VSATAGGEHLAASLPGTLGRPSTTKPANVPLLRGSGLVGAADARLVLIKESSQYRPDRICRSDKT
jgi:hypothetical protein